MPKVRHLSIQLKLKKFVINLKAIKLVKQVVSETLLGQLNAREDIQKKKSLF